MTSPMKMEYALCYKCDVSGGKSSYQGVFNQFEKRGRRSSGPVEFPRWYSVMLDAASISVGERSDSPQEIRIVDVGANMLVRDY